MYHESLEIQPEIYLAVTLQGSRAGCIKPQLEMRCSCFEQSVFIVEGRKDPRPQAVKLKPCRDQVSGQEWSALTPLAEENLGISREVALRTSRDTQNPAAITSMPNER